MLHISSYTQHAQNFSWKHNFTISTKTFQRVYVVVDYTLCIIQLMCKNRKKALDILGLFARYSVLTKILIIWFQTKHISFVTLFEGVTHVSSFEFQWRLQKFFSEWSLKNLNYKIFNKKDSYISLSMLQAISLSKF